MMFSEYVCNDSFKSWVPWHMPTHSVPWLGQMCAMTHSYDMCHGSFTTYVSWLMPTHSMAGQHKLQHTLQHTATHCNTCVMTRAYSFYGRATHCNAHCNTHCNTLQHTATHVSWLIPTHPMAGLVREDKRGRENSVLQCVTVLQCVAMCCSVLQCGAVWCSVVQCTKCPQLSFWWSSWWHLGYGPLGGKSKACQRPARGQSISRHSVGRVRGILMIKLVTFRYRPRMEKSHSKRHEPSLEVWLVWQHIATHTATHTATLCYCTEGDRMFIKWQPPKGENDDYDNKNFWISAWLPSRRRKEQGRRRKKN